MARWETAGLHKGSDSHVYEVSDNSFSKVYRVYKSYTIEGPPAEDCHLFPLCLRVGFLLFMTYIRYSYKIVAWSSWRRPSWSAAGVRACVWEGISLRQLQGGGHKSSVSLG